MASSNPGIPQALERFDPEVGAAFLRYRANNDIEAVQVIVTAAVQDLIPAGKRSAAAANLADHNRLIEDLGYDSLAIAEIVFFFEDLFQVRIESKDLLEIQTLGNLRKFVAEKLATPPASA